ncbi:uncharacterized protein LOC133317533 [Gastrolobium bilobum]|uniref:uncharacterized protein LOC133317533 n=1 Tax=Gastrolobium bilobum TaxID=150636 RepID=UPI002AB23BC3|nr:uncharacterized protein LOC133317533 [Gastrolobium bilobum]
MTRPKAIIPVASISKKRTRTGKKLKPEQTTVDRTVIPERGIVLSSSKHGDLDRWLTEDIAELDWELFVEPPSRARTEFVTAFLEGMKKEDLPKLLIRGVKVDFSPEEINEAYNTASVPAEQDEFDRYCAGRGDEAITGEVLREIGSEGATWGTKESIPRKQLKFEAKVWMHFINSRLIPVSNDSRVNWERAVLVFCILTKKKFDVGRIVYKQLVANAPRNLKANIPISDEIIPEGSDIDQSTIKRIRDNEGLENLLATQVQALEDTVGRELQSLKEASLLINKEKVALQNELDQIKNAGPLPLKRKIEEGEALQNTVKDLDRFLLSIGAFIELNMAPDTRSRSFDDRLDHTQAEIEVLKEQMTKKFQEIACKLNAIFDNHRDGTATSGMSPNSSVPKDNQAARNVRLKVPKFDGSCDPQGWIFKIEQFFEFYNIDVEQKLRIAPIYFDGKALAWYQWVRKNTNIASWEPFIQALQVRFGPSELEDYQGQLSKLIQKGSVLEYQEEFKTLSNKVNGLSESFLLSCFVSGLKPIIQQEVASFRPSSMTRAISLAKIQEAKLSLKEVPPKPQSSYPPKLHSPYPPLLRTPKTSSTQFTPKPISTANPNYQPKPWTQKITQSQMQEHEENSQLSDDPTTEEPHFSDWTPTDCSESVTPQISLHALSGVMIPQTLRFTSYIGKFEMSLLVDGGSTHNFLQPKVVAALNLPMSSDQQFDVMVGNGQILKCEGFCQAVPVQIQQHIFLVDFYVLPIQGADMVLGVQWLQMLGPVVLDYSKLTMEFAWAGNTIKLQGDKHTVISAPPPDNCSEVQLILSEFEELFLEPKELPPHRILDHEIHLQPQASPINVRPYRYPHYQKAEIEKQIQQMLDLGFIRLSTNPFSSPVLLVKNKDGSWRFCIDYRALNTITIKDRFPIPTTDELMDELGGSQYFSKLDLRAGYHQIRVHPSDVHKTAFRTHQGHYKFLVMPFGLTNAPSTFQATMNLILQPFLRKFVVVFFDDILIYSPTLELHLQHLRLVLTTLQQHKFFIKRSKCSFARQEVDYLGHVVTIDGLRMDPTKIQVMLDWLVPKNLKELRGFLGLTGYYRRFVCNYAAIATSLTELLKKDAFLWSAAAQQAFEKLKVVMTTAPVLLLPDFQKEFTVETDASDLAVGAVLLQQEHPIAYFSKKSALRMQKASAYVRELYAITEAVKKWRQYLLGRRFTIRTDQKSLRGLLDQVIQTPEQQYYLTKLLGFEYSIVYKPGKDNQAADALSRYPVFMSLMAAATVQVELLDTLRQENHSSPFFQQIYKSIAEDPSSNAHYKAYDGLLFYKGKLLLDPSSPLVHQVLHENHSTFMSGHTGIQKTMARVSASFSWPNWRAAVKAFVSSCITCQQVKYQNQAPAGLLQPISIPSKIWEDLSMDFIVGLPVSHGFTTILVVVDRLSKQAHFGSLPQRYTAAKVANLFATMICKLHGIPRSIITDRDSIFLSRFWVELFVQSGTHLRRTTAYHPQSDGQSEVVNRVLEQYLRCFVADFPKRWSKILHWAEYCYNTSYHSADGMTPFKAVFGRDPPSILDYVSSDTRLEEVDTALMDRQAILQQLLENLIKAQQAMKERADRKRRDVQYKVGDLVWVHLQPYRQSSVAERMSNKLCRRYFGPFPIAKKVGQVAYKLELPPNAKIHHTFHVSLLKPFKGDNSISPLPLPDVFTNGMPVLEPQDITDSRIIAVEDQQQIEIKVLWSGMPHEVATWEELQEFRRQYPHFNLEDKCDGHSVAVDGLSPSGPTVSGSHASEGKPIMERPTGDGLAEDDPIVDGLTDVYGPVAALKLVDNVPRRRVDRKAQRRKAYDNWKLVSTLDTWKAAHGEEKWEKE